MKSEIRAFAQSTIDFKDIKDLEILYLHWQNAKKNNQTTDALEKQIRMMVAAANYRDCIKFFNKESIFGEIIKKRIKKIIKNVFSISWLIYSLNDELGQETFPNNLILKKLEKQVSRYSRFISLRRLNEYFELAQNKPQLCEKITEILAPLLIKKIKGKNINWLQENLSCTISSKSTQEIIKNNITEQTFGDLLIYFVNYGFNGQHTEQVLAAINQKIEDISTFLKIRKQIEAYATEPMIYLIQIVSWQLKSVIDRKIKTQDINTVLKKEDLLQDMSDKVFKNYFVAMQQLENNEAWLKCLLDFVNNHYAYSDYVRDACVLGVINSTSNIEKLRLLYETILKLQAKKGYNTKVANIEYYVRNQVLELLKNQVLEPLKQDLSLTEMIAAWKVVSIWAKTDKEKTILQNLEERFAQKLADVNKENAAEFLLIISKKDLPPVFLPLLLQKAAEINAA